MRPIELSTVKFWNAAHFLRHAGERDKTIAVQVLQHVVENATGTVQTRAENLLKEIKDERSNDNRG